MYVVWKLQLPCSRLRFSTIFSSSSSRRTSLARMSWSMLPREVWKSRLKFKVIDICLLRHSTELYSWWNIYRSIFTDVFLLDFCLRHPESSSCGHETIPLVLSIPLFFSNYAGFSLLGLGDIVLPGLLVSFALRVDYCRGQCLNHKSYFFIASLAYAVGLLFANVMALALQRYVAGQPALMYIVPCLLGSLFWRAKCRDELQEMWDGPACLAMVTTAAASSSAWAK